MFSFHHKVKPVQLVRGKLTIFLLAVMVEHEVFSSDVATSTEIMVASICKKQTKMVEFFDLQKANESYL